jgi:predicted nucleic-acid-binding Zn-ribbon protein
MAIKSLEIETSETGVPYWRIYGAEPVAYVCNKCGYIELYDKGKMAH